MDARPVAFNLGNTAVSILTIGHLQADLAEWYGLSPEEVGEEIRPFLEKPQPLPVQSILIKQDDIILLIDVPRYDIDDTSPYAIPGYAPPPDLETQLLQVGTTPDDVTHVVITHPHFDHFNGLTKQKMPVFRKACHYLAKMDWEMQQLQQALENPDALESNTFGVLFEKGMLELVTGDADLGHGLKILPAPGETPGHQIVKLTVGEQVLYCLGDLFHHEVELWRPETAVTWANTQAMARSQHRLIQQALAESALLIASHIPGYGRLQQTGNKLTWVEA